MRTLNFVLGHARKSIVWATVDERLFCSTCWKLDLKICQYCNKRRTRRGAKCNPCGRESKTNIGIPTWFTEKLKKVLKK